MDLLDKVKEIVVRERLVEAGERVLLALSGGVDSTTMLHLMKEMAPLLSFDLGVAHINHLLRGEESMRDEQFVRDLAESMSLPCHVTRIDVRKEARESGRSLQHAGRDVRYEFLRRTAASGNYGKIGVAHTLDDQVETFILRTLKGTGIRGLSAIPMKRENIVRPLLDITRAEIEAYAREKGIAFVNDSSNEKTVYERNFIRKQIIPWMEKLNPVFREKIFLLLKDITAVNRIFDGKAREFSAGQEPGGEGVSFGVEELKALDEETRFRVMADLFARMKPGFIPLREHMHQIENVLWGARPNLVAQLPGGLRVKKVYGRLVVTDKPPPEEEHGVYPVQEGVNGFPSLGLTLHVESLGDAREEVAFDSGPMTALLDGEKLQSLSLRTFREGDRFVPLGMKAPVKLKDFFISRKIPREQRRRIPLLLSGEDIIWIVGVRIDERFKAVRGKLPLVRVTALRPA